MRVLVAEEGLRDYHGHWFEYTRDIVEGLRSAGHEVVVFGHSEVAGEIEGILDVERVFTHSRWHDPAGPGLRNVLMHNWMLFCDMKKALKGQRFDAVFAGNNLIDHVFGWWLLCHFCGQSLGRVVLLFTLSPGLFTGDVSKPRFPIKSLLFRTFLWLFAPLRWAGRVVFAAESEPTACHFEKFVGGPVVRFPHVTSGRLTAAHDCHGAVDPDLGQPVCFGCLGVGRYEKGTDLFQDAVRLLIDEGLDGVRFIYQWQADFRRPDGSLATLDERLVEDARVMVNRRFEGEEAYWSMVDAIDVMVLPYRLTSYASRLSRVAIEAMISGKPIVVTSGSWLESAMLKCGAGRAFTDGDAVEMAAAMREVLQDYRAFRKAALERVETARDLFSARRFVEVLERLNEPGGIQQLAVQDPVGMAPPAKREAS